MTIHAELTRTATRLGHNPAVVFRDAESGERTELSWATLQNWASKTANLLLDHFDAGLGSQVVLDLPLHWMAPVLCLGAWAAGAAVAVEGSGDVVIGHETDAASSVDLIVGAGMGGRPLSMDPGEALTVVDILAQPDDFIDDPDDEGAWAIGGRTQATLLAEGRTAEPGVRVMHHAPRLTEDGVILFAHTLPAGIPLVLATGYDEAGLRRLATEERVG